MPKKKGKKKAGDAEAEPIAEASTDAPDATAVPTTPAVLAQALQQMKLKAEQAIAEKKQEQGHKFWNTQPVPQAGDEAPEDTSVNDEIETKVVADVQEEPYALPPSFEWSVCDMTDPSVASEVYTLLCENYVEDDDNMFRFDYSREFLKWALTPPGYIPEWHLGVRAASGKKKLVGFITGIPVEMSVHGKKRKMCEINFLCVHKKLRDKRLAPMLIKEITRRVNITDVWQAVYTAGAVLPTPVAQNRYYHRSLNPKKLIEIGFSRLAPRMTMSRTIKLYKLPEEPQTVGIRPMEKKDIPQCQKLLMSYLKNFKLHQCYDKTEFEHWFLPREGVVNTYVVADPATQKITDMCSFYTLPSSIIGHEKYSTLKAAYSFYNFQTKTPWQQLMTDALILAKQVFFIMWLGRGGREGFG